MILDSLKQIYENLNPYSSNYTFELLADFNIMSKKLTIMQPVIEWRPSGEGSEFPTHGPVFETTGLFQGQLSPPSEADQMRTRNS